MNRLFIRIDPRLSFVIGILALLLILLAPAEAVPAPPVDGGLSPHPLFLWRVNGGKGTVFLLGSIHTGNAALYPLPREIEQAFNSADYLVEETNPRAGSHEMETDLSISCVNPALHSKSWTMIHVSDRFDPIRSWSSAADRAAAGLFWLNQGRYATSLTRRRWRLASICN